MVKVIERKRASALPPDERRTAIIEATLPLLLENGEMVTTRQIAEAAGIAEGTIFRVFADKDAVITAVIDAAVDPAPMEEALGELDPTVPLERVLTAAIADPAAPNHRGLAAHVERRPPLPRPGAPSDDRQPRAGGDLQGPPRRDRDRAAWPPAATCASLALSTSHPMMTEEPMPPKKIAALFLHGVGQRPTC